MKNKKEQISVQELSFEGKNNKYYRLIWTAGLTIMMTAGIMRIFAATWGALRPAFILVWCAAGAAVGAGILTYFMKEKYRYAVLLMLLPWPFFMLLTGANGAWAGARMWLNVLITRWNVIHEGGVALFSVQAASNVGQAFSAMMILATVELIWIFAERHHMAAANFLCLFWLMVQLISGEVDPLGCGILVAGLAGVWITDKKSSITVRHVVWTAAILVFFCIFAYTVPESEMLSVSSLRDAAQKEVRRLRYGEETLPEGNLYDAASLHDDSREMLKVHTSQRKNIYLRGFVGGSYRDGEWKPLADSAYGGSHSGMLNWLENENLDPLSQTAQYYNSGDGDSVPEANKLQIQVTGASRYYVYIPVSVSKILSGSFIEENDTRFFSRGLVGEKNYEIEELSSSRPSELMVADSWVSSGETDEQQKYIQAESVYRSFVYDSYRTVDQETAGLMRKLFWNDYESDSDGIYSAVSQVRKVLRKQVSYVEHPEDTPEGEDPVRWFLTESRQGNAMLYASAAVQALRVHGIPARYVEGYYVSATDLENSSSNDISLTGENSHAWVEVYFDGIGWLPVDVTPGYYYDAVSLQKMVSSPEVIQKNAVLQDNSFGAEEVTGLENEQKSGSGVRKIPTARDVAAICFGIMAVLIMLLTLILIICEIVRGGCIWHTERAYKNATPEQRIFRIEKTIYSWMGLLGIEAHLGWNTEETDRLLTERFSAIEEGEYSRVCELIEKALYGGIELEAYEIRTLNSFFAKMTEIGRHGTLRHRLLFRYAFAWKNRR